MNHAQACGFSLDRLQESASSRASERTAQKIRCQQQGHQHAQEQLIAVGAFAQAHGLDAKDACPVRRRLRPPLPDVMVGPWKATMLCRSRSVLNL